MTASTDVVLVTPRSFARGDETLRGELEASVGRVTWHQETAPTSAELARLAAVADAWIAGVERIDRSVLEQAGRLRVIARYGVGVDNVDLECAAERGIVVTNTPGANAGAVAELVIGLLVALARHIPAADRHVRAGDWGAPGGVALEGKTLGLIGFGAIGQAVAERVSGLRMHVLAYDPAPRVEIAQRLGVELATQDKVIARGDFISLHLPVLPETRGMVNASFLAGMKPGARLINAARGELVQEEALVAALRDGQLAGAALDALADEPPPASFPLGCLKNVILTPHIGAQTDHAQHMMARRAIDNCLAVLRGEAPPDPVTPVAGAPV